MKWTLMRGGAVMILTLALAIGAQAALASGGEVAAVKAAWKRMFLAEYFGPPGRMCGMMTPGERRWFQRTWRVRGCTAAARSLEHANHVCPSYGGISPAHWRSNAGFYLRRLHVHIRSAASAQAVDTALGDTETLVKLHGRWQFAHGLFFMQC